MSRIELRTIGGFELAAHLEAGGMADVYLAYGEKPGTWVVIKLLRARYQSDPEIVTMFRNEGRIMSVLDHPGVVRILGYGDEWGVPYIALEYLAGDQLGVILRECQRRKKRLSPQLAARLMLSAAEALAYIHSATQEDGQPLGLVHRDISPQNIFLCYDGRLKLLDFGIALSAERDTITRTGLMKGKLPYMSPEQIRLEPLCGRSDLFSLGIVIWELLAGLRLYKSGSDYEIMRRICEEDVPAIRRFRPDVPAALATHLHRCLNRNPHRRFPDAQTLVRALSAYLAEARLGDRTEELEELILRYLSDRERQKLALVESLERGAELRSHLFGALAIRLERGATERTGAAPADSAAAIAQSIESALAIVRPTPPSTPAVAQPAPPPVSIAAPPAAPPEPPPEVPSEAAAPTPQVAAPPPEVVEPRARLRPRWVGPALVGAGMAAGLLALVLIVRPWNWGASSSAAAQGPAAPSGVVATEQRQADPRRAFLELYSSPPSEVFDHAGSLGKTPLRKVSLPPGPHQLRLVSDGGEIRALPIEVRAGVTAVYHVTF